MTFGQASASTQILGAATFDPREAHICTGWTIYRYVFHVTRKSRFRRRLEDVAPVTAEPSAAGQQRAITLSICLPKTRHSRARGTGSVRDGQSARIDSYALMYILVDTSEAIYE
jgi:hypothetical protein